jgi:hypothetical protein
VFSAVEPNVDVTETVYVEVVPAGTLAHKAKAAEVLSTAVIMVAVIAELKYTQLGVTVRTDVEGV